MQQSSPENCRDPKHTQHDFDRLLVGAANVVSMIKCQLAGAEAAALAVLRSQQIDNETRHSLQSFDRLLQSLSEVEQLLRCCADVDSCQTGVSRCINQIKLETVRACFEDQTPQQTSIRPENTPEIFHD
ncbi:hypothetical protein SAMN05444714_1854 [Yoonia litorea]|uniref:Uncharacterized protein n=1 Tax=Yoonia litorea TaxID=1123755 RepID=A0A1I6MIF8_9RHOB|nr:hypothetical protein SAMN05444714_1854 [Yoonia litorea]